MKSLRFTKKIPLIFAGGFYFSLFSNLNLNPFFKSYLIIIPVQIVALIYGIYLIKNDNKASLLSKDKS